jgi:hydrogenase/urease accessory protein HupE
VRFSALCLTVVLQVWAALAAGAHELRPAFLDMKETSAGRFAIVWKVPALGDRRLALDVRLPAACSEDRAPVASSENNYIFQRWSATCAGGIKGADIGIDGLRATLTDVLVRIEYIDGATQVVRLTPQQASFTAGGSMSWREAAWTYFRLGVDHILTGFDHLLFVLALMLLIGDRAMLVKTITAFTLAHSITLAGAALGYMWLPQRPVEACIALSIAFIAVELVRAVRGERSLAIRQPWIVAFAFGLLHGFGFAGALREIGLPHKDVALSLVSFNLGVEAGQLLFVAAVVASWAILSRLVKVSATAGRMAAAYAIGTVSTVWLISRLALF